MGDIVNLRRARKAKARAASDEVVATNRSLHGISRDVRTTAAAEHDLQARRHAAHRRDTDPDPGACPGKVE